MNKLKTDFQNVLEELGYYAIPILTLRKKSQSPYLVGTGTLLRTDSEVFLITAKHVIDELEDGFIITSGKNGFIRFAAYKAAFQYNKGSGRDHDICVVQIPLKVIDNLHGYLKCVDIKQLSTIDPYNKLILYAFVGYPHSKNKPKPKSISEKIKMIEMKPYYYVVREFMDVNKLSTIDKSEELHVSFHAQLMKAMDVNLENNIIPPKPQGISGCGVWKIKLNENTGQIDKLALVGVGIEYIKKDDTFIATRIISPIMAINQFRQMLNKGIQSDAVEPRH